MNNSDDDQLVAPPRTLSYCNGQLCRRKYGAIENKAYTAGGESMFDFGYCRCAVCKSYYFVGRDVLTKKERKIISRCPCCMNFLRFRATTRIRKGGRKEKELSNIYSTLIF